MKNQFSQPLFKYLTMLTFVVALMMPSVSNAALNAYLTLTCDIQGQIEGDVTQTGREGSIEVYSFGHNISSPRDAASGLPTGKRQHRPVRLLKPIDKSTPRLYGALFNNENCPRVTIRFWRPTSTGAEEQYYTIELVNAQISSVMPTMPNNKVPGNVAFPVWEVISFTYQKIIVTIEDGGITAEDNWATAP